MNINPILEEEEENFSNNAFTMERKTDNTDRNYEQDDTNRISRATRGTLSSQKSERKLVVTRGKLIQYYYYYYLFYSFDTFSFLSLLHFLLLFYLLKQIPQNIV